MMRSAQSNESLHLHDYIGSMRFGFQLSDRISFARRHTSRSSFMGHGSDFAYDRVAFMATAQKAEAVLER